MHKPRGQGRKCVLCLPGRQGKAGVPVVTTLRTEDLRPARVRPRYLDGGVNRLSAANTEHHRREVARAKCHQPLGQQGPVFAHKVVMANIQLPKRSLQCRNRPRMTMSEVEHSPVAVAVDDPLLARHIPHIDPLSFAKHKVQPDPGERCLLAAGHMLCKSFDDLPLGI